jgi:hypothetical protein
VKIEANFEQKYKYYIGQDGNGNDPEVQQNLKKKKKRERSNIKAVIARLMSLLHGFLQLLPFSLSRFFLKVCNFISAPCP